MQCSFRKPRRSKITFGASNTMTNALAFHVRCMNTDKSSYLSHPSKPDVYRRNFRNFGGVFNIRRGGFSTIHDNFSVS